MMALVLAAGFGSRLRPFSDHTPKPLFTLNRQPLLDIMIRRLIAAGIDTVIVNTHHHHGQIEHFLRQQAYGATVLTRHEPIILGTGGAIRNTFWMQNKADVVGRPIEVPELEEATPLGAAILAGIGVGLYKDEQDAFDHVNKPGTTFEPNADAHRQYAERFKVYQQLYPALKSISHALG